MATNRERAAGSPVAENGATTPEAKRVRRTGLQYDLIQLGPTKFVVVDTTAVGEDGGWKVVSSHMSEATARLIARANNAAAHENAAKSKAAST